MKPRKMKPRKKRRKKKEEKLEVCRCPLGNRKDEAAI
jgi:hypothetical protein